jgi:hypothetical protein
MRCAWALVNYGYEDTVLLPVPIKVAADFKAPASGMVDVGLAARMAGLPRGMHSRIRQLPAADPRSGQQRLAKPDAVAGPTGQPRR